MNVLVCWVWGHEWRREDDLDQRVVGVIPMGVRVVCLRCHGRRTGDDDAPPPFWKRFRE